MHLRRSAFEELEPRIHRSTTVSTWSGPEDTPLPYYDLFAYAELGDVCTTTGGIEETGLGDACQQISSAQIQWDPDRSNGVDSSWVATRLTVSASGTAIWQVGSTSISEVLPGGLSQIKSVLIEASACDAGTAFSWSNLSIGFYRGNTLIDSASGAVVAGSLVGAQPDSRLTVTTSRNDCDRLVLTGNIRLQVAAGAQADPMHLFGQVLVSSQS